MNILDAVVFYTNDVDVAINFYTHQIGIELAYRNGNEYASLVFQNGIKLGIKKAVENREIPGAQTLIIAVKDAKGCYKDAQEKGLNIYKELVEEPWALEFSILDPDGNKIEYAQNTVK
jgi:predicted enzyme related to lactoylglutathione lyase